jgi:prepilin-type N-terminal cleavage/methylation domain-containing protein
MRRLPRSRRIADVRGFTLVELLVCMLILSIMAAIGLPAWLDQRAKGQDSEAKLTIRTAAIALESDQAETGTYNATPARLQAVEPSLVEAIDLRITGDEDEYEIREDSANATVFWMSRAPSGTLTRDCSNHGYGLCRDNADARGNHW